MKINVVAFRGGLFGSLKDDEEAISKMKEGEIYSFDFSKPRNSKFHRKYFALLQIVLENSNYQNIEQILILMKLKLGYYDEIISTSGKPVFIPKSISFAEMDDVKFEKFYNQSIQIILRDFLTNWQEPDIEEAINQVVRF